jgi:hypothetical protein|tara:strand:- start:409 stop:642 length:234 start_codon:yes stop_codon:yes gene_type:complete
MRRSSSTIPFGYKLSEKDSAYLEEIPEQLSVLKDISSLVKEKVLSLREGSAWIEHKTGRRLSHVGLKKIIDNERLGT